MSLQIDTFDDLLTIINNHPEWRRKLVKALFPEVDLPKALQELIESNRLLRVQVGDVDARLMRMEERQDRMDHRLDRIETAVVRLDRSVAELKGDTYESNFVRKADAIFGLFVRRGHDGRQEIANQLEMAEADQKVSDHEFTQVMAADLLWNGRSKQLSENISLVVEVSWLAEPHDLERAINRAAILRKIGLRAFPVVAAKEWADEVRSAALQRKIAIVHDYTADKVSWETAQTAQL
ncbi:MAG: hypothetical protein R3E79_27330 [Caldilineaceae bacterium]